MRNLRNIIITNSLALALGAAAFAHGGFDHVTGVLVTVDGSLLTVKTAKGNENVTLDAKTEITRGTAKATAADLKPGMRVIVDVPEESKVKPPVAHSVKIGIATTAKATKPATK
jgi:hypothetical protein